MIAEVWDFGGGHNSSTSSIHVSENQRQRLHPESWGATDIETLQKAAADWNGSLIKTVSMVIDFDFPNNSDTYLHRIGRCGHHGLSINLSSTQFRWQKNFPGQPCHHWSATIRPPPLIQIRTNFKAAERYKHVLLIARHAEALRSFKICFTGGAGPTGPALARSIPRASNPLRCTSLSPSESSSSSVQPATGGMGTQTIAALLHHHTHTHLESNDVPTFPTFPFLLYDPENRWGATDAWQGLRNPSLGSRGLHNLHLGSVADETSFWLMHCHEGNCHSFNGVRIPHPANCEELSRPVFGTAVRHVRHVATLMKEWVSNLSSALRLCQAARGYPGNLMIPSQHWKVKHDLKLPTKNTKHIWTKTDRWNTSWISHDNSQYSANDVFVRIVEVIEISLIVCIHLPLFCLLALQTVRAPLVNQASKPRNFGHLCYKYHRPWLISTPWHDILE